MSKHRRMKFSVWVKRLEKRGIVSRKPHPAMAFILSFIILILGIVMLYLEQNKIWSYVVFFIAGFSFIFAILHWIVVRIVGGVAVLK